MRRRDLLDLLVLAAVWGGSFLFMRIAVPEFGPVPLIELRVGLAALFLLPAAIWRGRLPLMARHWKAILVVARSTPPCPSSCMPIRRNRWARASCRCPTR